MLPAPFSFPRLWLYLSLALSLGLTGCAVTGPSSATDELTALMVRRLGWMDEVALVKHARSLPVTDPVREAELLESMAKEGAKLGLPEAAVRGFFSGQIEAAKECQREWLERRGDESAAPGQKLPDLATTVRPALDGIGKKMLAALVRAREGGDVPAKASAARARLTRAGYSEAVIKPALNGLVAGLR